MSNLFKVGLAGTVVAATIGAGIFLYKTYHFDEEGFNGFGFNRLGRDRDGFDRDGYDADGYDRMGFDREGWDRDGFSQSGFDKMGFDRSGFDRQGFDRNGYYCDGIDRSGISRQEAERIIHEVENLKDKAWLEMKSHGFREALTNIRTGLDHCIILMLKHCSGRDYDSYNCSLQDRINKCQFYGLFSDEDISKLQEARRQSNSIHKLKLDMEFNEVYFCYKTLEELIEMARQYLNIQSLCDEGGI